MVSVVEEDVRRHILEWEIRWRVREEWFRGEAREVFLELGAGSDSGLNVVVDARPIDQLTCTAFGAVDALVCRVEPLEGVPSARRRNDYPRPL